MKRSIWIFGLLVIMSSALLAADVTKNPHGKLSWECYDCHNTSSWNSFQEPMNFKHDKSGFPLIGGHSKVSCGNCHKDLQFAMVGSSCIDCHTDIHRAQFGNDCQKCHSENSWKNNQDIFSLHASRGFALVGVHAISDCASCHVGQQQNEFADTPADCQGCHRSNFSATTNPNHVLLGFPTDCTPCHSATSSSWSSATFKNHPEAFPLHGAHANIGCISCHAGGYTTTNPACYSCHAAAYGSTSNPPHAPFNFAVTCADCHNNVAWSPSQFNHTLAPANFSLNGAHATILCAACHINNQVTGLPTDCYGCHQTNFTSATNPDHVQGNFPHTCLTCHTETAWQPATFDHAATRFPLTGAHSPLQCIACHANGYQNTPFDCYSCHQANFNGATDPNHVQNNFDHNCAVCHSTSAWQPATFNHNNTAFPLTGAHTSVACIGCHANGYSNTPTDCYSCHQANFNGVSDPNHVTNNFSHDCTQCHSTAAWNPATFNHANTRFPLTGAHTSLTCIACHANGYQNTPYDCYSCHQAAYNGAENHVSGNYPHDCTQCHNTSSWGGGFNHITFGFELTGAHATLQCVACHASGFTNTPADCFSCHEANFNGVTDPNHVTNNFSHDCSICHSTSVWNPATFDHSTTIFPLTGAHTSVTCISCHANGYQNTPTDCYSCHQANFNGVSDPNHVTNNFSHDCTQCHSTTAWNPSIFDHSTTVFPLTGAHTSITCISCHANGYQNTPTDCYSCHQANFNGVTDPNHVTNNFSHDCTQCHSTSAWNPATFNHANTRFPLTGAHIPLACITCHANGYQNTPFDCYSCHQSDYNRAENHVSGNYPHDCTQCHSTSQWDNGFNHITFGFALTGAHATLQCIACHANGFQNTPADCYSCHEANFNGVTDPNHVQNNFDHNCTVCHSTSGWSPATFDHSTTTFPLTGAHTSVQCIACHANGYQNTPTDCYSCHQANFNGVADPNHVTNNFSHDCTICHSTTAWNPATFNHSTTPFPLTGAHASLACIACHANGYQNTPTDCYSCHQANFNGVTDPNHVQNNFDHNCTICHSTNGWSPATFNHSTTPFPLTGAHTSLACIACHANGYQNTPTDCYSCHQANFNGVTDPNHVTNNFSHDCTICHSTTAWNPSTFNHSTTPFPLTGAHTSLACIACHANGYQNTPTDCYSCHQANFNGVTDPNHVQNNFNHDCTQCHSTSGWSPATFDHSTTTFPLTGAHTSVQCIACHANGYQNTPTDCYSCHQTNFIGVTDPNHVTNNFSHDCTICHSTTAWNPSTFNHSTTPFPLTGAHVSVACIACHANGYQNTPTDCYSCHQANFNGVTDPNHVTNNFSHDCTICHSTTAWNPATFNHSTTPFPLTGAHISLACIACHANGYQNTPTDCYSCHQTNYNNTTNPNHVAAGFPTTCATCHNTSAWVPSTWNHDALYFPIYSGNHRGRWTTCADCHVNPNDYHAFECIFCHEHNQTDTNQHHQGIPNYQYNSQACYTCHPRGNG